MRVPNFDDALLGLPGFWVLAVTDDGNELLVGSGRSVGLPLPSSNSPSPVSPPWQHDQSQPESTERTADARHFSDRS